MLEIDKPEYSPIYAESIVLKNLPDDCKRILDFGCGDARFTIKLLRKGRHVYGCDSDKEVIETNKKRKDEIIYSAVATRGLTAYKSSFFDCITLMGVLEHVKDERETIKELHRILKKGGTLFIYVHNKSLFGFLDTANIKFVFPTLHKYLYYFFLGKERYIQNFITKKDKKMFGDFTTGKKWHTHYSRNDLLKLLGKNYKIEKLWYYSFLLPIFLVMEFLYVWIFRKTSKVITFLIMLDNKISLGQYSYSIVLKCLKK